MLAQISYLTILNAIFFIGKIEITMAIFYWIPHEFIEWYIAFEFWRNEKCETCPQVSKWCDWVNGSAFKILQSLAAEGKETFFWGCSPE